MNKQKKMHPFVTFTEIDDNGGRQKVVVNITMIQRMYESKDGDNYPGIWLVFYDGCSIKIEENIDDAILEFCKDHVSFE